MSPYQVEHPPGCCPLGGQTRDSIDHFYPFLPRLLDEDMPPYFEHLCQSWPSTVAHQRLTRRQIACLDAPMADIHCAHMRLAVARRRQSEDQLDIGLELRLVVFDDHDIIAPAATIVCATCRCVSRASIVTMRPARTISPNTVSTSVISFVLAATACCVSVSPPRWVTTDNRCVSGAPCFLEPRRVLPSTAMAISGASGAAGTVATRLSAQAPTLASNASRSMDRKMVCSVAAQGVGCVKPRA